MTKELVWVAEDGEFMRLDFVTDKFARASTTHLTIPFRVVRPIFPDSVGCMTWIAEMRPEGQVDREQITHKFYDLREFRSTNLWVSNEDIRTSLEEEGKTEVRRFPQVRVDERDPREFMDWSPIFRDGPPPGWHYLITNGDWSDLTRYARERGWKIKSGLQALTGERFDYRIEREGWASMPTLGLLAIEIPGAKPTNEPETNTR